MVAAACRVTMDIDDDLLIKGTQRYDGEWFDNIKQEWDVENRQSYFKQISDPLKFCHFIFGFMFHYKVHMYRVYFKFDYWKYPFESLKKLKKDERDKLRSHFYDLAWKRDHHNQNDIDPKYSMDKNDKKTNFLTYPTLDALSKNNPQTVWHAEIWEFENEKPGGYYDTHVPQEKKLQARLKGYQYSQWGMDYVGATSAMGIRDLAKNIKDVIDKRGGNDDESELDPTPIPVDREPTLVPA